MATITITMIPGERFDLYRVELRGADDKVKLSRRFRERAYAFGMAMDVGTELGIDPDYTPRTAYEDGDTVC